MTHENPHTPWLEPRLKARVDDFEVVLKSRFPSLHDKRTRAWGKALGRIAAHRRWAEARYDDPRLLRTIRQLARMAPDDRQLYGHLRPASG
jgi:hypothetical protein